MASLPPPMPSVPPPSAAPPPTAPPERREPTERRPDEPPWRTWSAPAAIALGFALGLFATIVVGIFASLGGSSLRHPSPAVSIATNVLFDLSFVAAALYFASQYGRLRPADFGFRIPRLKRAAAAFVVAGGSYYALTAVYAALFNLRGKDKLPSELGANRSTAALIAAGVFVCVIAPIAEELFFRGFVFGALRRWRIAVAGREIGTWLAAAVTGVVFGLAHTGSAAAQYLVPLGFLGFVLCLVRWRTGSLYPCMALHCTNNALALAVNQLGWSAGGVLGLILAANAAVAAVTWPLAAGRGARIGPPMHSGSP